MVLTNSSQNMRSKESASAITAPSEKNGKNSPTRWSIGQLPKSSKKIVPRRPPLLKPFKSTKKLSTSANSNRPNYRRLLPDSVSQWTPAYFFWTIIRDNRRLLRSIRLLGTSAVIQNRTSSAVPSTLFHRSSRPSNSRARMRRSSVTSQFPRSISRSTSLLTKFQLSRQPPNPRVPLSRSNANKPSFPSTAFASCALKSKGTSASLETSSAK